MRGGGRGVTPGEENQEPTNSKNNTIRQKQIVKKSSPQFMQHNSRGKKTEITASQWGFMTKGVESGQELTGGMWLRKGPLAVPPITNG